MFWIYLLFSSSSASALIPLAHFCLCISWEECPAQPELDLLIFAKHLVGWSGRVLDLLFEEIGVLVDNETFSVGRAWWLVTVWLITKSLPLERPNLLCGRWAWWSWWPILLVWASLWLPSLCWFCSWLRDSVILWLPIYYRIHVPTLKSCWLCLREPVWHSDSSFMPNTLMQIAICYSQPSWSCGYQEIGAPFFLWNSSLLVASSPVGRLRPRNCF